MHAAATPAAFVPIDPVRVLDTRVALGLPDPFVNGQARTLRVAGTIPVILPNGGIGTAGPVPAGVSLASVMGPLFRQWHGTTCGCP